MISCDDDIAEVFGGVLTISGLKDYNNKYVIAYGISKDESIELVASANVNANNQTVKGIKIEDGKVVLSVWIVGGTEDRPTFSAYKGSDTLKFGVSIYNNAIVNEDSNAIEEGKALVTFKNGVGGGVFFDFDIDIDFPDDDGSQNSGISVDNITIPSTLAGTWKGDDANGILVFTGTSISTTDLIFTKAYACIAAIKKVNTGANTVTISGNGTNGTISYSTGGLMTMNLYTWEISGTTLTIKDNTVKQNVAFTGTKQQ